MLAVNSRTESDRGEGGVQIDIILSARRTKSLLGDRRSGGAMVEVKQSAKPLGFANGSFPATRSLVGGGDDILKSLMISLALMMGKILFKRMA
jgi:hypothetical protein